MIILVVDDEVLALEHLHRTLTEFCECSDITLFASPILALDWISEHQTDIAFLDIDMYQLDGITLAKKMKQLWPHCAVIFTTGYSQYALEAIQLHASGYLMKPVHSKDIRQELDYILNPHSMPQPHRRQIRVQCFGNFEVFMGNEPLKFQYSKTRELLAYLVDRKGAFCSNGELLAVLWEERDISPILASHLRNLLADLISAFKAAGYKTAILKRRGQTAIVPDQIDCDYYNWLKGQARAINAYSGEYMSQYSWGECTLGELQMHC